jgi:hypothetical protein
MFVLFAGLLERRAKMGPAVIYSCILKIRRLR